MRPARFCLPTPRGLARALGAAGAGDARRTRRACCIRRRSCLLAGTGRRRRRRPRGGARAIAWAMARGGWPWGPAVLAALGLSGDLADASAPPAQHGGVGAICRNGRSMRRSRRRATCRSSRRRRGSGSLTLLGPRCRGAAAAGATMPRRCRAAFAPRDASGEPNIVLAEAGTGVGKTLGYLAPATPLGGEERRRGLDLHLHAQPAAPDRRRTRPALSRSPAMKALKAVVRKGRENYLCLLNLEEAARGAGDAAAGCGRHSA